MRKYLLAVAAALMLTASVEAAAQSAPPRKDIPAIAKAADGSIVSIVMSDKAGKPIAQGSGFFVSKDGLIVTNYHVISEGSSAIAKFPDGAFFVVDGVVASDKTRDVALIKAHGRHFRTLTLGNSERVQVGEEVVAIGNPLSLESTVSNGIVSGVRTSEELGGKFLQTTAPISPGSSGGPLFNMAGEVIGINTLHLKGGENLNFAIPINDAKRLLLAKIYLDTQGNPLVNDLPNEAEPGKTQVQPQRPSLANDALEWMQNTLDAGDADLDEGEEKLSVRLIDFSGCLVHFVNTKSKNHQETFHSEEIFNLGDVDPTTIRLMTYHKDQPDAFDIFDVFTQNKAKKVIWKLKEGEETKNSVFFGLHLGYAVRFTQAFNHAVELCGGKPSIF